MTTLRTEQPPRTSAAFCFCARLRSPTSGTLNGATINCREGSISTRRHTVSRDTDASLRCDLWPERICAARRVVGDLASTCSVRSTLRYLRRGDGGLWTMAAGEEGRQRSSPVDWRFGDGTLRDRYPRGRSVECDSLRRSELIPASYGFRRRPSSRRGAGVGQRARLTLFFPLITSHFIQRLLPATLVAS